MRLRWRGSTLGPEEESNEVSELVAFVILGVGMFLIGLNVGAWYEHRNWMQATQDWLIRTEDR